MQWRPDVCVAAIITRDDRYLLVEEDIEGRRVFNQPAGHLEQGESLIDAARREVLEETGRQFCPEYLTGIYRYPNRVSGISYLRFCFYGSCGEQDVTRQLDHGILRTVWMTLEEMETRAGEMRSPMVLQSLKDYLAGCRYSLEILNDCLTDGA